MKIIKGDLIKMAKAGAFDIIVHGANCQNVMGAGIASQIKQEFPEAFEADRQCTDRSLGKFSTIGIKRLNYLIVVNAYTQILPGPNASYDAIAKVFGELNMLVTPKASIGIPQIGCGIGGLKWPVVKTIIEQYAPNLDITCVIYDKG